MQDPEPNSGKMSGLKLDQIKGILKSEGEENVFEIGASLVLDPGQSIRTTESEDGSAVVINDQLVKAKEDLTKAITDESDRAIAKEGEIEANLADAVSDLQEDIDSNVADLEAADKAEAEARESADKSIMATAAENKSELNDKIEKTKEDLTTALTEGDAAIQKQIDFILEGSTEKLDQVVEIVQHIENIDVENDASLASAVASLTATDIANKAELTKFIEDEITGLNEELEANVADLEAADKALDSKLDETKAELNKAIEDLTTENNEEHAKRSAEIAEGDAAIQKQIDFILEGSTEKLDQVVEIVQHIENIDVENDASLASAVASLTATDVEIKTAADELAAKQEADNSDRKEEIESLSDKQSADNSDRKAEIESEADRAKTKEAAIEANLSDAVENLEEADKSEAEAREAGDKELFVKIDETKAELSKSISDSVDNLEEADKAEEAAREAGDKALDTKLDETKAELNQAIENENDRATTKEAEIEANLADAVKDLEDADKAETEAREDADKAETEAREKADKSEAEAREAGDKELFVKIDETKAELNQAISTAVSQAVQNEDFTQDSISLLGKSVGETVSFEVSGNAGVVLVFANGLYVPSTTSFDEEGEKTTVSFEMFFEGGEDDFAHFMTVDFS